MTRRFTNASERCAHLLAVAVVAAAAGACATLNEVLDSVPEPVTPLSESQARALVGTYTLTTMAGQTLPFRAELDGQHLCPGGGVAIRQEIPEGTLVVHATGRVELSSDAVVWCRLESGETREERVPQRTAGQLRDRAGSLVVNVGGSPLELVWAEDHATVTAPQLNAAWVRAAPEQRVAPGRSTATPEPRTPVRTAATAHLPAQCRGHEELEGLPEVPAADTAGLGARIGAAFPGWSLATEAEIGCAAILSHWNTGFWSPHFRSGETWWVQRGDVTGDGQNDVLAYISRMDERLSVRAVLLTAAGEGVEVSYVHGIVVHLGTGGMLGGCRYNPDTGTAGYEEVAYPHAALSVSNNENWAYTVIWHDGELVDQAEVTGLGACH
jgi:hypothetical protein